MKREVGNAASSSSQPWDLGGVRLLLVEVMPSEHEVAASDSVLRGRTTASPGVRPAPLKPCALSRKRIKFCSTGCSSKPAVTGPVTYEDVFRKRGAREQRNRVVR